MAAADLESRLNAGQKCFDGQRIPISMQRPRFDLDLAVGTLLVLIDILKCRPGKTTQRNRAGRLRGYQFQMGVCVHRRPWLELGKQHECCERSVVAHLAREMWLLLDW
jgi:hypothetical protein